ncbi:hypothetical protein BDV96DRAFT_649347 [Lophiotrema nucula]|uniref:RING-type domain-containing protein n=1 Tax=Lophiotrema nucula TaxID=690887 RepID=A0A6A5YYT1_9PLEO|nr:hypothetical protein BDV96DRAFT_649347 [Lophiotrema nucula]
MTNPSSPIVTGNSIISAFEPALCQICLEPYDKKHMPVQISKCGHQFGEKCLEKWLTSHGDSRRHKTCPQCRGQLAPNRDELIAGVNKALSELDVTTGASVHGLLTALWSRLEVMRKTTTSDSIAENYSNVFKGVVERTHEKDKNARHLREHLGPRGERTFYPILPLIEDSNISRLMKRISNVLPCFDQNVTPPPGFWRAILIMSDRTTLLKWENLTDASSLGRPNDWKLLYLFLWVIVLNCQTSSQEPTNYPASAILHLGRSWPASGTIVPSLAFLAQAVLFLRKSGLVERLNAKQPDPLLGPDFAPLDELRLSVEELWRACGREVANIQKHAMCDAILAAF